MRKPLLTLALGLMAAAGIIGITVGDTSPFSEAASHRDAPLISEDPTADNTDVYAFVSTDPTRSNYVTLISNYIPLEEPADGPNYFRFSENVLYEIKVDTDGDAEEDLTYQFDFKTNVAALNQNTFLYNVGMIGAPLDPSNPASQYTNLNQQQSYTLTEIRNDDDDDGRKTTLLRDARVAPNNVGPKSIDDYATLADAAIHTVGSAPNEIKVFAGQRDEGFYIDLGGTFDLLNYSRPAPSFDHTSGFNVHTIALEIPKSLFAEAGDEDGIIGVWGTANRPKETVLRSDGRAPKVSRKWVQVSRLGNPLVNEVLLPLSIKDKYNAMKPEDDGSFIAPYITDPGTTPPGNLTLVPALNALVDNCIPTTGRFDLDLALLSGIPAGVLGLPGTQDTQNEGGPVKADVLHLNMNVTPTTGTSAYSPLGAFGGDVAGFPNGRRVGDDVLDIAAKAAGGAILHLLGPANGGIVCPVSLDLSDNVPSNDVPYLDTFPYLGLPHQGFSHEHDHGVSTLSVLSLGMGLLGFLLAAAVAGPRILGAVRRRVIG